MVTIGHALGLKHSFDEGANHRPTFAQLGIGAKNTGFWTIMSHSVTSPSLTAGNEATPMPLDILAIRHIYGANTTYHARPLARAAAGSGGSRTTRRIVARRYLAVGKDLDCRGSSV